MGQDYHLFVDMITKKLKLMWKIDQIVAHNRRLGADVSFKALGLIAF